MNETTLKRHLQSIGSAVFVECFSIFKFYAQRKISKVDCIAGLMKKYPNKQESGCQVCCSQAKLIFASDMQRKALSVICEKTKLADETIEQVTALLRNDL